MLVLILLLLIVLVQCYNNTTTIDNDHINFRIISIDNNNDNDVLVVRGYGFGNDNDAVNMQVGNKTCNNLELCSKVCQPCDQNHCSHDSVCIMSKDKGAHCFMPCSGSNDNSCPCNMMCDSVKVHAISTGTTSLLNLCTPRKLLSEDICRDFSTDKIQCSAHKGALMSSINTYETKLYVNTNTTMFSALLSSPLSNCDKDKDCYDGSICTIDTCIKGQCVQKYITDETDCINFDILNNKGSDTFYGYRSYINQGNDVRFSNYMVTYGKQSSTSSVDDYPIEQIKLPFSFQYFGTLVKDVAINPNGILTLPPFYDCHNVINSVSSAECIAYATDSNTIGIWASDWDPSSSPNSNIYYYHQKKGDSSNLFGVDNDAFHVLFSHVARYQVNKSESVASASFSASIYADGSIRISYLQKDADTIDTDVFNLWGSRASQSDSNRRYHEEKIARSAVENGTNIYYCNIDTIGCIEESCVSPNDYVKVRWKSNSCTALADIAFICDFGGLATTVPVFSETDKNIIQCPVPNLPVKDNTVVSFTIRMVSSLANITSENIIRSITIANYELTQSQMTIRYSSMPKRCGCSSLYTDLKCDASNVCGGTNDIFDCYGTPFGSAYFDSCHKCRGGLSGISPMKCFVDKNELRMWIQEIVSFTMLLCLFSFISASFYVIFARMANARQNLILRGLRIDEMREQQVRRGLNQQELEFIGELAYSDDMFKDMNCQDEVNCTECSICLGKFKAMEAVRLLPPPCGHSFHVACIDEWFKHKTSCPNCKRDIKQIIMGGDGTEEERHNDNQRTIRISRNDVQAMQMLFTRINQTRVSRGLVELRRMINRGGNNNSNNNNNNNRSEINFAQIPQVEEEV